MLAIANDEEILDRHRNGSTPFSVAQVSNRESEKFEGGIGVVFRDGFSLRD